ncbi:transposase [Campylobacter hyointestinalis]|uniref:transposase n=1 Tax=Campylobacter hyointestinalis TaxID=198 RepID=UPI00215D3A97|nr:transposase [Campylobacter hyointestinalis]
MPKTTCFIVEVVYEKELPTQNSFDKNSFISLDLGLNNFVTAIDTKSNQPFIINGKGIKSVNQFYNKLKANSKAKSSNNRYFRLNNLAFKKECKINDFIHKASDLIIKHCLEHKIANIIIGKNKEWKQEINLGKKTNLNFTSIPYQSFI